MIKLRPYQIESINKIKDLLKDNDEAVLASAPSSGKTVMAISIIKDFIKDKKNTKVVILAHGSVFLLDQWKNELKGMDFGVLNPDSKNIRGEEMKKSIILTLPQTFTKINMNVDLLVIDEAHHFTREENKMFSENKKKASKILYLTGTPSKFILSGTPLVSIPGLDLIQQGYISNVYVGMFTTMAKLKESDYNESKDLKSTGNAKLEKSVEKDMESMLETMTVRLRETGLLKSTPKLRGPFLADEYSIIDALEKTLISCSSIKQASLVYKFLKSKKIECLESNHENDLDSKNIELFKNDEKYKVLIVVNRAILGFNFEDLVNVVDLTGSRNVDRIYQLYARVMRIKKGEENKKKYFFKIANADSFYFDKIYMTAALCMLDRRFIDRYDGKNLSDMKIVLMKEKIKKKGKKRESATEGTNKDPVIRMSESVLSFVQNSMDIWNCLKHVDNGNFEEVSYVKIKYLKPGMFNANGAIDEEGPDVRTDIPLKKILKKIVNYINTGNGREEIYEDRGF